MKVSCISLKHSGEIKAKLESHGQDSEVYKPEDILVQPTPPFLLGLSFPTQTATDLKHQNLFHLNIHMQSMLPKYTLKGNYSIEFPGLKNSYYRTTPEKQLPRVQILI